jgi:hypothetical protein
MAGEPAQQPAELPPFPETAFWIGSAHPFDLHEAYLDFRSPPDWTLARQPQRALLYLTADSRYRLWVNGIFVARGPARCYPWRQSVDCLDITAHLQSGPNVLAVQVYQPGYSHFAYVHRGAAGLLAHLVCDDESTLWTDTHWRVRRNPSFAADVPRVSIYGSGVEERDLHREDDWTAPDYVADSWSPARIAAPVGGYPWTCLRLRTVPLLVENEVPIHLLETRQGVPPAPRSQDAHGTLRAGWDAGLPSALTADSAGWYAPKIAAGESASWLFDLGWDHACQGWAEIRDAIGGEQLLVSYAEKIRAGQLVLSDPETYCRVRLTDRFLLGPGDQAGETFALRGGRYLLFQLIGPTAPGLRLRFHARASAYPLPATRTLETSDPELAAIAGVCERTFRACLQDGFVDSTWRESSQWVGDALPQALIMAALCDDVRPLRQVIAQAADGAYPDGVLPGVVPGEVHAYTVVDYNFMWVELLAICWRLTGAAAFVRSHWPVLIRMLDRFARDCGGDGLLRSQPGRRLFLDWAPVSRQEPSAIYNLHYLLALQTAGALAEEIGGEEDGSRLASQAAGLRDAVRAAFWRAGRWHDDPEGSTFSQLATSLAILTGAATPEETLTLLDEVAARSLDPDDEPAPGRMVLASPFMHHYVFEALHRAGRSATVVEIIRLRWGRWVRAGYPTTWENWSVDFPDGSQCHAFSAHPRHHLAAALAALSVS